MQPDQLSRRTFSFEPRERLAADEAWFGQVDDPAQARLVRIGGAVDVVAVQCKAGFGSQRVARAQATRTGAVHQRRPDVGRRAGVEHHLEAVFAGVAGARHECGRAADVGLHEGVAGQWLQVGAARGLQNLLRPRALDADERRLQRPIVKVHIKVEAVALFGEERDVVFAVRGIEDEQDLVIVEHVADHVVEDAAVGLTQHRVGGFALPNARQVARAALLGQRQGIRPAQVDATHVRQIEQTAV